MTTQNVGSEEGGKHVTRVIWIHTHVEQLTSIADRRDIQVNF